MNTYNFDIGKQIFLRYVGSTIYFTIRFCQISIDEKLVWPHLFTWCTSESTSYIFIGKSYHEYRRFIIQHFDMNIENVYYPHMVIQSSTGDFSSWKYYAVFTPSASVSLDLWNGCQMLILVSVLTLGVSGTGMNQGSLSKRHIECWRRRLIWMDIWETVRTWQRHVFFMSSEMGCIVANVTVHAFKQ